MNTIDISICIPTHNRAKLIEYCLKSLVEQVNSNEIASRIEIIVVDNHSDDETELIVKKFTKRKKYIRYLRNKKNIGPALNIIECFKRARGKYIWLLGDDDISSDGSVRKILSLASTNVSLVLLGIDLFNISINGSRVEMISYPSQLIKPFFTKKTTLNRKQFLNSFISQLPLREQHFYWGAISNIVLSKEYYDRHIERYLDKHGIEFASENLMLIHHFLATYLPDKSMFASDVVVKLNLGNTNWKRTDLKTSRKVWLCYLSLHYNFIVLYVRYYTIGSFAKMVFKLIQMILVHTVNEVLNVMGVNGISNLKKKLKFRFNALP